MLKCILTGQAEREREKAEGKGKEGRGKRGQREERQRETGVEQQRAEAV